MEEKRKYDLIDILCAIILAVQFAVVIAQVVSRYVFNKPLMWTDELAKFLLIYITFFGCVLAEKYDQNVRFDFLIKRLPPIGQLIANILVDIIICVFYLVIIYYGIQLSIQAHFMQGVAIKWIRWSYIYACIPISFALLVAMHVKRAIRVTRGLLKESKEV